METFVEKHSVTHEKKLGINRFIDHTLLAPTAVKTQIIQLIDEAVDYGFFAVCIHPTFLNYANVYLERKKMQFQKDPFSFKTKVAEKPEEVTFPKMCTVIGFPLGIQPTFLKMAEMKWAILEGATEIDMVINLHWLKEKKYVQIENEISELLKMALGMNSRIILKVILETCLLNDEEIKIASKIVQNSKAHFLKTSTGFSHGGATPHAVELMFKATQNKILIKASGGIKTFEDAKSYIQMGVSRIGTSQGIQIFDGVSNTETASY